MESFRSEILSQIEVVPEGRIFTFQNLVFPIDKFANVAVLLSELTKKNKLNRIEKGAYYKPRESKLGLGMLPVYQEEQLNYLTNKLGGYLTGPYIYNKMSLTEQVPTVITIAVHQPVRPFKFKKLFIKCVKAYVNGSYSDEILRLLRILDAIKDLKHIPGISPQIAYNKIFYFHLQPLSSKELERLTSFAMQYPARVRKILSDMLERNKNYDLKKQLVGTICPTTRFDLPYEAA
jgi:hypothetical protein